MAIKTSKNDPVITNEAVEKTPEEIKAFVMRRADMIKKDSSVYKYYMNTPLSELKTKDEKLIKKELERREQELLIEQYNKEQKRLAALSEDTKVLTEDDGVPGRSLPKESPVMSKVPTYNAPIGRGGNIQIGDSTPDVDGSTMNKSNRPAEVQDGGDPDPNLEPSLFDSIMDFITSLPQQFMGLFAEGSVLHTAYNGILDYIHGISEKVFGKDTIDREKLESGVEYTFMTAAAILALVGCWKLVKKYVSKDGTVEANTNPADVSVATSEGIEDNESYYALQIFNEGADANSSTGMMNEHIKKYADKMLADLLVDESFVKYMSKNKPALLEALKKYKKDDAIPVSENAELLNEKWAGVPGRSLPIDTPPAQKVDTYDAPVGRGGNMPKPKDVDLVSRAVDSIKKTAAEVNQPSFFGKMWNAITSSYVSLGNHLRDATMYVGQKIGLIKDQIGKASDMEAGMYATGYIALLIIGLASLWYYYKKHKKNPKDTTITNESNMLYLDKVASLYTLLDEAKSKTPSKKEVKADVNFPDIKGKGESLVKNLCTRARHVSMSLITDKDFVAFAKKTNPEVLSYMKAINKKANSEESK